MKPLRKKKKPTRSSPNSLSRLMRKRMRERNKKNQRKRRLPARKGTDAQLNRQTLNRQTGRTPGSSGMLENVFEYVLILFAGNRLPPPFHPIQLRNQFVLDRPR